MTAPVLYKYNEPKKGRKSLKMSFFLAVSNPPEPVMNSVSLNTMEGGAKFYVR